MRYRVEQLGVLAVSVGLAARPLSAQAGSIVGTWHGTSTCTNLAVTPACKDEVVIYDVATRAGTLDTVDMKADKVVNGVRDPMGDLVFTRRADGVWISVLGTSPARARWKFTVRGDSMAGQLVHLPGGEQVRRVAVGRARASG